MTKRAFTLLLLSFALFTGLAAAQTTTPTSRPHQNFVDQAGVPCAGCSLYSYNAGTTTPTPTFADYTGGAQNTNPIILDAAGGANIWLGANGGNNYKFVLQENGVTQWTVDQVPAASGFTLPLSIANGGTGETTAAGALANLGGVSSASNAYQAIDIFGDSITQGTGSTTFMAPGASGQPVTWPGDADYATATYSNGPTAYAYKLLADFGNSGHDYGRGGDLSTDMTWHVATWAHPTFTGNPARTAIIGTNDNSLCGSTTNCQDTTTKAELFSAAQATIPDTLKTFASSCTPTGSWAAGDIAGSMVTTTNGASLSCVSPSSTAITYIAYEKCDNTSNGTASVTVNGSAGSLEPTLSLFGLGGSTIGWGNGTSFASGSGQYSHCTLALARNGGVVGSNTTVITATNTGRVEVFWVGGPYVTLLPTYAPPLYVIGGVPYEQNNANPTGVAAYNTIARNAYLTMVSDGNNVRWADVQSYMNSGIDFNGGSQSASDGVCGINSPNGSAWAVSWNQPLHPGDGGHCHIYHAFRDQVVPSLRQNYSLGLQAGPSGFFSTYTSLGGRYGADGGLNAVGAASALLGSNTGSAATVQYQLQTPGSNLVGLGQWGTGNGLGLPGITGLLDNTAAEMIWWSNGTVAPFFCLFGPTSSTTYSNCVGAGFVITSSWFGNVNIAPANGITGAFNSATGGGLELLNNNNGGGYFQSGTQILGFGTFTGAAGSEVRSWKGLLADGSGKFGIGSNTTNAASDPFNVDQSGNVIGASLKLSTSVLAGAGMQHKRSATFSCGTSTKCNSTITWSTAFADANYTATCTLNQYADPGTVNPTVWMVSKVAASVTMAVFVNGAVAIPAGTDFECIGMHD